MNAHVQPAFTGLTVESCTGGFWRIRAGSVNVAVIGPHGMVDWLSDDPLHAPPEEPIWKEAHLGFVRGVKFELVMATPFTQVDSLLVSEDVGRIVVEVRSLSADRQFVAQHRAVLALAGDGRLQWTIDARFASGGPTVPAPHAELEYGNVYPARCGNGWLQTADKRFNETLISAADGTLWSFPHQHALHYGHVLSHLDLAVSPGSFVAFAGPDDEALLIETLATNAPLTWAICDMFYDLHCLISAPAHIGAVHVRTRLRWAAKSEAASLCARAKRVTISPELEARHRTPRIALGRNRFTEAAGVSLPDDAAAFRPDGSARCWLPQGGPDGGGALQMRGDGAPIIWQLAPDSIAAAATRIRAGFRARVDGAATLRLRLRTFAWDWAGQSGHRIGLEVASVPLRAGDWCEVELPALDIPPERRDETVVVEWLLDGAGSATIISLDLAVEPWSSPGPAEGGR